MNKIFSYLTGIKDEIFDCFYPLTNTCRYNTLNLTDGESSLFYLQLDAIYSVGERVSNDKLRRNRIMHAIGAAFYIFAALLFGYTYQALSLDLVNQTERATQSRVMAQHMVYYAGLLDSKAMTSPNAINKQISVSDLNVPSWMKTNSDTKSLKLAIDNGMAFVYCVDDCPSSLINELLSLTHNSPFVGKVVDNQISSPVLNAGSRSAPDIIPNGAIAYSQ